MWLLPHPQQKDAESAKKTAGFAGVTVAKLLGQILENHRIFRTAIILNLLSIGYNISGEALLQVQ
jgi:hypothetical protein